HWNKFLAARKRVHRNLKSGREEYISNHLGEAIKENPKRFWSYVKRLNHDNPGVADFEVDGKVVSDSGLKSEILNSVFTKENLESIPEMRSDPTPGLGPLIISEQGVLKLVSSLNRNKAWGPDQVPPWFLKTFAADITPILTDIFQDSIDRGTVPRRWREANVCAVFKKGKKSDPANYRRISLTFVASKILEHIVHSYIMKHLNDHNILTDCQHGFRAKTFTEMQLILTLHDMAKAIQSSSIHAVVLELAKAFDKVPHRRLLWKLYYYGFQGPLLTWLDSFLTQLFQSVVCEGQTSSQSPVTSGVPQVAGFNPTQPLKLPKECKGNCIYIPRAVEAEIRECGLGSVFKERVSVPWKEFNVKQHGFVRRILLDMLVLLT
ncbi:LINE-1 retrotransposable element ORF2 protein, partial [Stylophora pistillata]